MFARPLALVALLLVVGSALAAEPPSDAPVRFRATVELTDGSRLIGAASPEPLSLDLGYARLDVPLDRIRRWDAITPKPGRAPAAAGAANRVVVQLTNGDRLTGTLDRPQLKLDTLLGPIAPPAGVVRSVAYTAWREGNMPPGEGDLSFGGLNWLAWRTEFAIESDRLRSLPRPRPGFRYGHDGHGRGPNLFANIGDPDWRDYSLEVRLCPTGVDPAFNPYGLGSDFYDASVMFHVADAKESHNERGSSFYILGLHGATGTWELRACYNHFCDQPVGWGNPRSDGDRTIAQGTGLRIDRKEGNRVRVDVLGNRIRIWFDGEPLVDAVDTQMNETIGGQRLDHGGIGFGGGFDAMFWIEDLSVRSLGDARNAGAAPTPH